LEVLTERAEVAARSAQALFERVNIKILQEAKSATSAASASASGTATLSD
jgi:hypothetical protein